MVQLLGVSVVVCGLFVMYVKSSFSTNVHGIPKVASNTTNFYGGDHEYGYVEVRKDAFMFWWLYYAGGDKETAYEKPFIIWVQGGPGIPGSGVGNFLEVGPRDIDLQNRNSSWVHKRNVLFIDSPVGTGFSYVKNDSLLVKTDNDLTHDLVELIKQFLKKFPKFETVPTHIFSQSYGGKIAPRLAYYLHKQIRSGRMTMNLKTVGLGSAFVSPKFYTLAYSDYLYNLGFIDQENRVSLKNKTIELAEACNKREYMRANEIENDMFNSLYFPELDFINMYNVIKEGNTPYSIINPEEVLEPFMNSIVKPALADVVSANTTWLFTNPTVYDSLRGDLMRPSNHFVEKLLNQTNITIAIYNGQLDLVTSIPGASQWVHRLKWDGAKEFKVASRHRLPGYGNGYYKSYGRLSFWWIYKAGHSISFDNPEAMVHILNKIVDGINFDL